MRVSIPGQTCRRGAATLIMAISTLGLVTAGPSRAQGPSRVLRVALLPQWVVQQHRGIAGTLTSDLRAALDGGVVDRTVYSWQRTVIDRRVFVPKPIRLVPEDEAQPLGGRGRFTLAAVRPPAGSSAWTEIEIAPSGAGADDVVLVEIGGERNTVTQVLESFLVAQPDGALVEIPLARRGLVPGTAGVPLVRSPFEQPLPPALAGQFRNEAGMGLLAVRGLLQDVQNGARTVNGFADTVPLGGGDWREGDRVFLRIPAAALERGLPGLVLVWKDRTLQTDPSAEFPRKSALPFPAVS